MNKLIGETEYGQEIVIKGENKEYLGDVISCFIIPLLLALGYHPASVEEYITSELGSFYEGFERVEDEDEDGDGNKNREDREDREWKEMSECI